MKQITNPKMIDDISERGVKAYDLEYKRRNRIRTSRKRALERTTHDDALNMWGVRHVHNEGSRQPGGKSSPLNPDLSDLRFGIYRF